MSRRYVLSGLLALSAFGLTTGLTAGLGVSSDQLGAGTTVVTACDENVTVKYGITSNSANASVSQVTLGDLAAACNAETASVVLLNSSGVVLDKANQALTVSSAGASVAVDLTADATQTALASEVTQVSVTITG